MSNYFGRLLPPSSRIRNRRCLFVCLLATLRKKTYERICIKFSMNKRLNFGGDPVTDPDRDTGEMCQVLCTAPVLLVSNYGRPMEYGRPLYSCHVVSSSIFLSFFFPRLFSAVADWMSTILLHMVWP